MRARTFLFDAGLESEVVRARVADAVRLGAEPKMLEEDGAPGTCVAFSATLDDTSARFLAARPGIARVMSAPCPYPRVARRGEGTRAVELVLRSRERVTIGGALEGHDAVIIAGPCAVESEEQLDACARVVFRCGGRLLRGGAYKPRTSPYAFAGHGLEGLRILRAVADRHGLGVVTEVLDPRDAEAVATHADVLQIGARTMSDFALLRAVGATKKPVLLKRAPSATLEELLLAAEHLAHAGAEDIILCERGVRSFDPAARNLLDLAAVPLLQARTDLPVLVDPSHGVGVRRAVLPMAAAAIAAGADGVIVECHPDPGVARSDGFQALTFAMLERLFAQVAAVSSVVRPLSLAAE